MQWDASPNGGFTTPEATPWLPLAQDYRTRNVASQANDPASMLSFFRRLSALRRAEPALKHGHYAEVDLGVPDVLAYRRTWPGSDGFLVVLNLGEEMRELDLRVAVGGRTAELVLSSEVIPSRAIAAGVMAINGNEGLILRLR